ncbi:tetratricopeptide repeat protein [Fulvivirga ligni]|uniref:tetratricopeptide repeat protein n=1 Tax=Fulvivirga ligni TaxID=2904246 RepID=UPI001F2977E4|nr:tetratricopeptide repeat protein [Fulvivirga ligni]UII20663.1 tetratricopeptide repeat protein [Fulvivirga ligni]
MSHHFGYEVPPADEELLLMGSMLYVQLGQADKVELFLNYAVQYYPKSEQAQFHMAQFYIEIKNKEKAIEHLTKAYEINHNDEYLQQINELKE